jgi:hypothetical protein
MASPPVFSETGGIRNDLGHRWHAVTARGAPMRAIAVIVGVVCAVAALVLAFMTHMDVSMAGFPDGHLTDYDAAVGGPLRILTWVLAGLGFLFLALVFVPITARTRTVGLLVAVVAFAIVAMVTSVGVPWYFGTHLNLDNGIGG